MKESLGLNVFLLVLPAVTLSLLGGWTNQHVDDEGVQKAAQFAVQAMNSLYETRLSNIASAETQVVNGINYRLNFNLEELDCKRRDNKDLNQCNVQKTMLCTAIVYKPPGEESHALTESSCVYHNEESRRFSRSVMGGQKGVDMSDTQVNEAVQFAIAQLSSESNGLYGMEFHRLVTGTKQLVAGILFRLHVHLVLSSCEKPAGSSAPALSECVDKPVKSVIECHVEVLDQAWVTPRHTLSKHRCHPITESDNTLYFEAGGPIPKLIGGKHDVGGKDAFESFKQQHGKKYDSAEEEAQRRQIFNSNMKLAKKIQEYDQGTATYGASQFADMTPEEFQKIYLPRPWNMYPDGSMKQAEIPQDTPPKEFDWRQHNAVTEVKNQGSCGSCWAFSVTGNIEGQWAIQRKQLLSLSEQELVDCDKLDEGCNGGLPSNAYKEIQRLGGLEKESDYPYEGDDEKCAFVKQSARVYINGSLNISKDEEDMKSWIYKNGPASIGINAFAMQFYLGGVSHPWKLFCAPDFLDHGVLIVGYGVKKGWFSDKPYWIVKNSWGPSWGEKGYYLVYRGAGVCGLNQMVSSALVN